MEKKIWMVWVAGNGAPKRMHPSYESALAEAQRLKEVELKTREIFIFESVHVLPGRKLIQLKRSPSSCKVEPQEV